jgi:hypothetical protein
MERKPTKKKLTETCNNKLNFRTFQIFLFGPASSWLISCLPCILHLYFYINQSAAGGSKASSSFRYIHRLVAMALVKKGTGGSVPMFLALVIVMAIAVSSACLAATASNAYICSSTTCGFSSYLVLRTFGMLHFHFTMFIYIGIASYLCSSNSAMQAWSTLQDRGVQD